MILNICIIILTVCAILITVMLFAIWRAILGNTGTHLRIHAALIGLQQQVKDTAKTMTGVRDSNVKIGTLLAKIETSFKSFVKYLIQ